MQRRKHVVSVLAVTAALATIVPTVAQAKPSELVGNDRAHYSQSDDPQYSMGPAEIPYLSQGIGVDEGAYRVNAPATESGIGVDDRALPRGTSVEPTPIVVTKDSGSSVDFGNSYVAALALMLGVLAGGTLVAIWNNRRTGLSPA